jgi:hypothetical protein
MRCEHIWSSFSLGTLSYEADGISVVELIAARMIEEHRHYVADFRAGAPRDWQTPQPGLHFNRPNMSKLVVAPTWHDPMMNSKFIPEDLLKAWGLTASFKDD